MIITDKRNETRVTISEAENGYMVMDAQGVTKNISEATLKRWFKATDEAGNEVALPIKERGAVVYSGKDNAEQIAAKQAKEDEKAKAKAEREAKKAEADAAKNASDEEKAAAKAVKDAEKAAAKEAKEAEKAKDKEKREADKKARIAKRAEEKAAKEANLVPEKESPVPIVFVSEELTKATARANTFTIVMTVGDAVLRMKDIRNSLGRGTVACDVVTPNLEEVLYKSPKCSAKDCVSFLNKENVWTADEVEAINREIRRSRKAGVAPEEPFVPAPVEVTAPPAPPEAPAVADDKPADVTETAEQA